MLSEIRIGVQLLCTAVLSISERKQLVSAGYSVSIIRAGRA